MEGFNDITYNLTATELEVVIPIICRALAARVGQENAITNNEIQKGLYNYRVTKYREQHGKEPPKDFIKKYDGPRIRMMLRYIRVYGLVRRLASSSNGYWVEPDDVKLRASIESIYHRASANYFLAKKLREQLEVEMV